jgi:hypothetical protein
LSGRCATCALVRSLCHVCSCQVAVPRVLLSGRCATCALSEVTVRRVFLSEVASTASNSFTVE